LVIETCLYYDERSEKHQTEIDVFMKKASSVTPRRRLV